jgi:hypothetical protein
VLLYAAMSASAQLCGLSRSALTPSPSPLCGSSRCNHVRRVGSRLGAITAWISHGASRGSRQRSVVPSSLTIRRDLTPDLRSAYIAACAETCARNLPPSSRLACGVSPI